MAAENYQLPIINKSLINHEPTLRLELFFLAVAVVVIAFIALILNLQTTLSSSLPWVVRNLTTVLTIVLVTVVRLGTFRPRVPPQSHVSAGLFHPALHGYDHMETDECIFEV